MSSSPELLYKATPEPGPEDLEDAQELTDEELYWAENGMPWCPEPAPFEDSYLIEQKKARLPKTGSVLPSAFTAFAFRMPKPDGTGYEKFSFEGRRHMIRPYDTPARRVLLVCARQTEKSTLLGNKALGHCCLLNSYKVLYVSPSSTQTKTFSNDRIKDPSETSPILKSFTTTALSQNIFEKQYINRSKITMRYAFLNADRCAVGSTRVHFTDGSVATLEEIHQRPAAFVGRWVWSADPTGLRVIPARLLDSVDQGVRPVVRVRLEGGVENVCALNQPLLTWEGWKKVEDLPVGTLVAVPRRAAHGVGNDIPVEEYRLVGYLLGDGHLGTFNNVKFFNGSTRVLREFRRCARSLGAELAKIEDSNRKKWVHSHTKQQRILKGRQGYKKRLLELDLIGKRHDTKRVPPNFFTGNEQQIAGLLGAIYATDGWASVTGEQFEIGYCSNSRGLLEDLHVLLLRFGISSFISRQKKPSTKKALGAFTLSIRSAPSVLAFCAAIPVLGKEVEFRRVAKAARQVTGKKDDTDRIPLSYAELRVYLQRAHGLSTHSAWAQHRIQLRPGNTKDSIGRRVLRTIAEKLSDRYLTALADSELGWARVESITQETPQQTYDLTIDKTENYLVDGLFIHNTRGIPAHELLLDEFQDILADNIPIIEQCTSHSPEELKRYVYAGTPKSLDNNIEYYRVNMSTQGEWVVPCDACGSTAGAGRYWNILGEKNIGKKGLSCERCGKLINPMHDDAQWAFQVAWHPKNAPFESYRIPQLMVPWKPWDEILLDYKRYPRDMFYNEVLGISFDSGMRPLTQQQVKDSCVSSLSMHPRTLEHYQRLAFSQDVFMGIDWGTGESGASYTIVTLGTYVEMKYRVFLFHRFEGEEAEPPAQLAKICELVRQFNVRLIGADYGGGFDRNDHLVRQFGPQRVQKFQYMARTRKKVEFDNRLMRWKVHRTEVMSDIFNAIKRKQFEFPRWEEFKEPYGQDMLNIFSEYNETLRMTQYSHGVKNPDDSFHSLLYGFLASIIVRPRPDIIAPQREEPGRGPQWGGGWTPVDQGLGG